MKIEWGGGRGGASLLQVKASSPCLLPFSLCIPTWNLDACIHMHMCMHTCMCTHACWILHQFSTIYLSHQHTPSILWLLWAVLVTVGEACAYQRRVPNLKWKNPINPKVYFSSLASSLNKMQWFQLLLHRIFYVLLSKYVPHLYDWVGQHLQACLLARVWYQPWEGSNWPGLNINKCSYSKVT